MEDLALSLLENHLSGFEPTISRYGSQSRQHLERMMTELTLIKVQKGNLFACKVESENPVFEQLYGN